MTRDAITLSLDNAALLTTDRDFPGLVWMTDLAESLWGTGVRDWEELYQPLIKLLYDIGFLGIIRSSRTHYSFRSPGFADHRNNLRGNTTFAVNPAFRPALDIH